MGRLTLKGITKRFGRVLAVNGVDLEINDGEFIALVGTSGCGKTTTLRMIAGLEKPDGGEIELDGKVINKLPPDKRDIAVVFQDYVLYPHMTVYDNMAFGLSHEKLKKSEIDERINETAGLLNLSNLLGRYPGELSGGQAQRVALGRALVRKPKVFLMDEPLSNLDPNLRSEMRGVIKRLHMRLKVTTVFVTHDQHDALSMGDRIVVMNHGEVQQIGTGEDIYDRPETQFVGGFFGTYPINFFDARAVKTSDGYGLDLDGKIAPITEKGLRNLGVGVGEEFVMRIRSEHLELAGGANQGIETDGCEFLELEASLQDKEDLGAQALLYAEMVGSGKEVVALTDSHHELSPGDSVKLRTRLDKVCLFDKRTEKAIGKTA